MLTLTLIFENIMCWRNDDIEDAYDVDNVDDDNDDDYKVGVIDISQLPPADTL